MMIETSRRSFLGAAAGVAGLGAIGVAPASAVIEPEPWGIKLGIATYSLRMFDRPTAIEMLKKFQVKYVSIKDVHLKIGEPPEATKAGRAEFDAAGLVVTSGGNIDMTKGMTVDDLRKLFEYAKDAGMPMMVCAPTHENIKPSRRWSRNTTSGSPSTITVPKTRISPRRNPCWKWCATSTRAAACAWTSATPRAPASTS